MTGVLVWMTGKPSSGKSTLGQALFDALTAEGVRPCLLDGDQVRGAIVPPPGYDEKARDEFYFTLANLASLLVHQGHVVIVPATASRSEYRERARGMCPSFVEVFVDASLAEVQERDAKGLYRAVREGRVTGVPGADEPYDEPRTPAFVAQGGKDAATLGRLVASVLAQVRPGP